MYEVVFIHFKDSSVTVLAYCFNPRIPAFFAFFARDTGYFSQQRPRPPTQKSMETLSRIGTALTAGCGATLCVHPLDVVRVNLQVDSTGVGKRAYNGTFDCIKKIAARDGAKGLVRLVVPCFLLVPEVVRVIFDFLLHVVEDAAEAVTNHELDAHG